MYLFELEFSSDICPGMGFLDHMVTLFVAFEWTSTLFSTARGQFTVLPTVYSGSLCSTPYLGSAICELCNDGHSGCCGVMPHCRFSLHLSENKESRSAHKTLDGVWPLPVWQPSPPSFFSPNKSMTPLACMTTDHWWPFLRIFYMQMLNRYRFCCCCWR